MIYTYAVSERGSYHKEQGIVLQDSCKVFLSGDREYGIAAVADGVGSSAHSEIASKIAVNVSVDYCTRAIEIGMLDAEIEDIIINSFYEAQSAVDRAVKKGSGKQTDYNTTLSLAVFIDGAVHYGHAGDSGIVALTGDGRYEKITEQQNDEDGRVFPLCLKNNWKFGTFYGKITSVFLATDGIYNTLFPFLLRNEKIKIYHALAQYFMDNRKLQIETRGEDIVQADIKDFITSAQYEHITDDKTVVCLVNTSNKPDWKLYSEPDWEALKKKPENSLYPKNTEKPEKKYEIFDSSGRKWLLNKKSLIKESDWSIFETANYKGYITKLYQNPTAELEEKIQFMVNNPPQEIITHTAWPIDILRNNGHFCGYIANKINMTNNLVDLCNDPQLEMLPFSKKIAIAHNICKVIKKMHDSNYMFYTFDPHNIYIDSGTVVFFNIDSCTISGKKNQKESSTFNISIAESLFQLLMNGISPYNKDGEYLFKYEKGDKSFLPIPSPKTVQPDIGKLFHRTFVNGIHNPDTIPGANKWYKVLTYLEGLKTCTINSAHQYTGISCPWCETLNRYNKKAAPVQHVSQNPVNIQKISVNASWYEFGIEHLNKNEYNAAIADFEWAIKSNQNIVDSYKHRGYCYFQIKEYTKAIVDFDKVIELDPKNVVAYTRRGDAYRIQEKYDKALADYDQALNIDPEYKPANNMRTIAIKLLKKSEETNKNESIV
ncbi:hypothetical protein FACS1894172_01880 [Spirochaetia bacterium]|nr:hypothetical protein FACS1894172_01880 [Spirochaetia bacterium]